MIVWLKYTVKNVSSCPDPDSSVGPSKQNPTLSARLGFWFVHPFENGISSADPVSSVRLQCKTSY
ncbi:hypothetical protein N9A49_01915 [Salibacteraceae bacterium]|nr:hypothetical protein [Salibacteraceae bacterium]